MMHSDPFRYNLDHLKEIEDYVEEQARENTYDLEANLAVLKLYQFNPHMMDLEITYLILLKSLTNLPHTDFVLAKCLLLPVQMQDNTIREIIYLADILEQCDFQLFWDRVEMNPSLFSRIVGFYDSIRKFVCHVVGITFQTVEKSLLSKLLGGLDGRTGFQAVVKSLGLIKCNFRWNPESMDQEKWLESARTHGVRGIPG